MPKIVRQKKGKQSHQCKCCSRQFVLNNEHTKSAWLKALIKRSLKERLSLRATCRLFGLSLNLVAISFAHHFWEQIPDDLSLSLKQIRQIRQLQMFGLQAGELWSFVQKKRINVGFG
ncbi:MAG: hypothetical protein ACI87N_002194 [Flavobacteriales bacterium]